MTPDGDRMVIAMDGNMSLRRFDRVKSHQSTNDPTIPLVNKYWEADDNIIKKPVKVISKSLGYVLSILKYLGLILFYRLQMGVSHGGLLRSHRQGQKLHWMSRVYMVLHVVTISPWHS